MKKLNVAAISTCLVLSFIAGLPRTGDAASPIVDQFQLVGTEQNQAICCNAEFPSLARGQSFTVGVAGVLSGLELSLFTVGNPSDLVVAILDMTNGDPRTAPVLGNVSVPASAVGPLSPILNLQSITATFIDLAPLGISVKPGDQLAFLLKAASPLPSSWAIQTAIFSDFYSGGRFIFIASDNSLEFLGDAAFKTFVEMPSFPVTIDIKPGSFPNSIDTRSKGVIPVAILTTDTFDATTVDPTTVHFGVTGNEVAPVHSALEDVDGDGHTDIILQFNTQATGIQCGDASASLTGTTFSGQVIVGSDSINTVACK